MRRTLLACLTLVQAVLCFAQLPKANPMVFGNNRLTVITPTLLRLEYATDGKFVDVPTMFAVNRSSLLPISELTVKELGNNCYEIRTAALRIWFRNDGYPFSTSNLKVYYTLDGKEKTFTNRFVLGKNLGGPVETLDRVTEAIPMNDGLLTRSGWYMIDDNRGDLLVNGWLQPRDTRTHLQDQYCFIYGNDYRAALASLGVVSGHVPMTRKYMHGVWYCRYWDYTADEFLGIIHDYDNNQFPLDNLVFDMGWHTNDATEGTGHNGHLNWTGYTWNRKLIPNPAALIDSIHKLGVTVSLNDHPHDGIRPNEDIYPAYAKATGLQPGEKSLFNLSDSTYMKNFFTFAHRPSEKMGVDFWWLDWQQNYLYPYVPGTHTTTLSWINQLYYRDSEQGGLRGCNYSRWGGWGDHRHPLWFSGDAQANWPMLAFEVKLSAQSGNAGCYYWIHDTGGFRGKNNPELTTRWTQFSTLSAALRVHSTKDASLDRRPWISGDLETRANRRMYHLRSELMPYVYSSVWQTHKTMVPLNRAMYIDYGNQPESYENEQEFTFGDIIMAAPITSPGKGANLVAAQKVWFPRGENWFDFFNHQRYEGGQTLNIEKSLMEFPMYVKGGWVLPMQPYTRRPATTPLETLVMRVYPAGRTADNVYALYEDDGITLDYEKGASATTRLQYIEKGNRRMVVVHPAQGNYKGQVNKRAYRLQLAGFGKIDNVKVNGRKVATTYDANLKLNIVDIASTSIRERVTIEF